MADVTCKCGTGSYCHVHHQYRLTDKELKSIERERILRITIYGETHFRTCGGGRQVVRKREGQ